MTIMNDDFLTNCTDFFITNIVPNRDNTGLCKGFQED